MEFTFTPQQDAFRAEIRAFVEQEVLAKGRGRLGITEKHDPDFYQALADRGYIGMQWPDVYGGQGRSHVDMAIFYEEMAYANAPLGRYTGSVVFVGESLIAYGSLTQREQYLPKIARGEITCCWCLSEPDAGSDAASLRTRAIEMDDGGFCLTGQKIFTSGAHIADVALVAARTNSDVPKHKGISLFLVSMHEPGVAVRPLWTLGGWRVNQVFFDKVQLPRDALVGQRDNGWPQVRMTLSFERSAIGKVGLLMRIFDLITSYVEQHGNPQIIRRRLDDLSAEIEALRWISYEVAWRQDHTEVPDVLASISKLRASELTIELAELGMEVLGEWGAVRGEHAELAGEMEYLYRNGPFFLNGGGTPDIQRLVIADRGLGLPR